MDLEDKLRLQMPADNAPLVIVGGFLTRNSTAYWGDIDQYFTEQDGNKRRIIIAPVGACSSVHDRACEIYYSLMGGGRVDYGAEHAIAHKHGRYGRKYPVGLYPQWSIDNPVHFVSHSLGGPTVLKLISLLRTGFFNRNRSQSQRHHRHHFFHHHHHHHQDSTEAASETSPTCHPAMVRSLLAVAGPFQGTPGVYLLGAPYNGNETTLRSFSIGNFLAKYIHISSFLSGGASASGGTSGAKKEGEGKESEMMISGLGEYDSWDWQGDSRNLGMFDGGFSPFDNHNNSAAAAADGMSLRSKRSSNTALSSKRPQRTWRAFKRSVGTLWTQLRKSDWADSSDSGSYDAGMYAADMRERAGENVVCPEVFYASFTGSITLKHSDSDHHRPDRSFRGDLFVYIMAKMIGNFSYKLDPVPEFLYRKATAAEEEEEEEERQRRKREKKREKERRRLSALALLMPTVVLNHSRTSLEEFTSHSHSRSNSNSNVNVNLNLVADATGYESRESMESQSVDSHFSATTTMEVVPLSTAKMAVPAMTTTTSSPSNLLPPPSSSSTPTSGSVLVLSPAELLKIKLKKKARRESLMLNRRSMMTSLPSVEPIAEESSPISHSMPGAWPIPEGNHQNGGRRRSVSASTSFEEVDEMRRSFGGDEEVVRVSYSNESMRSESMFDGSDAGHGCSEFGHELSSSQQAEHHRLQQLQQEAEPRLSTSTNSCGSSAWHSSSLSHSSSWSSSAHSSSSPWSSSWSSSLNSTISSSSSYSHSPSSSYFPPVPSTMATTAAAVITTPSYSSGDFAETLNDGIMSLSIPTATAKVTVAGAVYVTEPTPPLLQLPVQVVTSSPAAEEAPMDSASSSASSSLPFSPTSPGSGSGSDTVSPVSTYLSAATSLPSPSSSLAPSTSSSGFLQVPEPPSLQVTPPTPLNAQESLAEKFGSLVSVVSESTTSLNIGGGDRSGNGGNGGLSVPFATQDLDEDGDGETVNDGFSMRSQTPTPTAPGFAIDLGSDDADMIMMGRPSFERGGSRPSMEEDGTNLRPTTITGPSSKRHSRHSRRWSSTDRFAQWAQQWTERATDPLRSFSVAEVGDEEQPMSAANMAKLRKNALDKLVGAHGGAGGAGDDGSVKAKSEVSSSDDRHGTAAGGAGAPVRKLRTDLWENDGIVPVFSQMHPSDCSDGHCRHHGTLLLRDGNKTGAAGALGAVGAAAAGGGTKSHRANKSTSSLGATGTVGASTTSLVPSPTALSCPGTPLHDSFSTPTPTLKTGGGHTSNGSTDNNGSGTGSRLRRSFTFDRKSFDLSSLFAGSGGHTRSGSNGGGATASLGGNETSGMSAPMGSADALRIGMLERGVWHVFQTPGMPHNCLVGGVARYEQQRSALWKKIAETVKDLDAAAAAAKLSGAMRTTMVIESTLADSPISE